jgi:thioredoxin-related protein
VSPIEYTTRHGAKHALHDQKGDYILLYFRDGNCQDCNMVQLRLETDVAVNNLMKAGKFKIVDIYVGVPDDAWKSSVESLPYEWEAGYSSTVGNVIDVRELPRMYLLDKNYKIVARGLNVNQILSIAAELNKQK